MLRRIIASVTLVCMAVGLPGCYSRHELTPKGVKEDPTYRIESLVTVDGRTIYFETKERRAFVFGDEIVGFDMGGTPVKILLSEVRSINVAKYHKGQTTFAVVALSAATLTLVWLKWRSDVDEAWQEGYEAGSGSQSCPFIYSFDGSNYVFDGEPYDGAICEGLKRSDLCELQHLRPADGEYHLLLSNELDETQFSDQLELVVVDHAPGVSVLPDERGNLHSVCDLNAPLYACDSAGKDWRAWLAGNDELFWESDLLSKGPATAADLRDTLWLAFRKPAESASGKLVVSARNSLLSSQILRKGTEIRGERLDEWYDALGTPEVRALYADFLVREELGFLKVRVWIGGQWETCAEFNGSPPLVFEEFVVPLDFTGVEGDTLKIMLAPPAGYWELNRFAMDYSSDAGFRVTKLAPTRATSDEGRDVTGLVSATDGDYLVMEEVGRSAEIAFEAPPEAPGKARTIFARACGYYEMHMDPEGPMQAELLERLEFERDFAIRFALQDYHDRRDALLAARHK